MFLFLSTRNIPLTPPNIPPPPRHPPPLIPPVHISNSNQQINKQINTQWNKQNCNTTVCTLSRSENQGVKRFLCFRGALDFNIWSTLASGQLFNKQIKLSTLIISQTPETQHLGHGKQGVKRWKGRESNVPFFFFTSKDKISCLKITPLP